MSGKNNSKAVILFHAYTGSPNDVYGLGRALERAGYTVLTPTFDGHDKKDPNEILKYGIEDWTKNGHDAYQSLKNEGFTNISAFGLSLGGIIATDLMLTHDVKSYGVFASPVIANGQTNIPKVFWGWYQKKMKKLGFAEAEIQAKQTEVMHTLDMRLKGIDAHVGRMMADYSKVKLPVFIAQGGRDRMINPKQAYLFKEKLVNAKVDFHWYEEAPHVLTVGHPGRALRKDLLAFLEKNT